ncbi:BQ5605_C014g07648 [Microbotryum silenes-dioicae]|uniref:DASH complex subunit DAM1 n=1 Tax=Microbotryum silenes-dioicae TaxID=796604 RepID=A0A2X0LUI0_9BASI|nr:BQ5605_C014g07648 [Microbotryum silenes-dioicae]
MSLSHSRSRDPSTHEPPLQHLAPVFAELADSLSDLTGNLRELDKSNDHLDGFNTAFASYLYGLRITAYTADFNEAPALDSFKQAEERRPPSPQPHQDYSSPPQSPHTNHDQQDDTFITNASQHSFVNQNPVKISGRGGRGGATLTRGTTRGGARVGGRRAMTKKQREEMNAFADHLIQSLPLKYREQQPLRAETEKVIHALREHPNGLSMVDAQRTTGVANHRVNDAMTALVRVKFVVKVHQQGATVFRLDPSKFSPAE